MLLARPLLARPLLRSSGTLIARRFSGHGSHLECGPPEIDEIATSPIAFETISHLRKHGYAVLDNFLTDKTCDVLADQVDRVLQTDHAVANSTHVVEQDKTTKVPKSHVIQAELTTVPRDQLVNFPALAELHNGAALAAQASVMWPRLTLTEQAVKAQATRFGGGFPIHVDSAQGHDSRLVTALIYPRDSAAADDSIKDESESGGVLRVFPNPVDFVDIHPRKCRLVLLASRTLHHSVTPHRVSSKDRLSITVWMSGNIQDEHRKSESSESVAGVSFNEEVEHILLKALRPPFRDLLFRIAWEERWLDSLYESHDTIHADRLANAFRSQLDLIRDRLPAALISKQTADESIDHISKIFQSQNSVRDAYMNLRDKLGGNLPFHWT